MTIPIHTLGIDTFTMIDQETHCTTDIEINPKIGIEATQIVKISDIKTKDREIIQTIDQIIQDLTTTIIKIDREITHKIGIQTTTIDKKLFSITS